MKSTIEQFKNAREDYVLHRGLDTCSMRNLYTFEPAEELGYLFSGEVTGIDGSLFTTNWLLHPPQRRIAGVLKPGCLTGENDGGALAAPGDKSEEQVALVPGKGRIPDLTEYQNLGISQILQQLVEAVFLAGR